MLLNRNSNSKTGLSWLVYIALLIILAVVVFGARHKIQDELRGVFSMDKKAVEEIVANYIKENPQEIINSVQEMQKREQEEMMKQAQMKIHDSKDKLQGKGSEIAPFAGNKDGDVVIVSFLDYRCGYCKRSNNDLKELIKKDPKVKVVFKELPVLGPPSQNLSKAALAVYMVDSTKYMDFHNSLMDLTNPDDKAIDEVMTKLNLDVAKVRDAMKSDKVQKELESIAALAGQLNVRGTPAFIIDEELIPGAIDLNTLIEKIKAVRESKKGK